MSDAKIASEDPNAAVVDLQLLKDEENPYGFMCEKGIATITFYKGDFKEAAKAIRAQFALVIAANPWLCGRLVTAKDGGVRLRYPVKPSDADLESLFNATSAEDTATTFKLSPNVPFSKITSDLYASKNTIVQRGGESLDKDLPVTLLTLSESEVGKFALVFSLSHVVGDGRTYYELFKMLQPGATALVLQSERIQSFSEAMRDMCGRAELALQETVGFGMLYTFSTMLIQPAKCVAFYLDDARVAAAKAEAVKEDGVAFVSTNDIISSAFFNVCNTRLGWVGIDCRGRMDGIASDLAGNYVSVLTVDEGTYKTPGTIRKMLTAPPPFVTTSRPFPSCCSWFCGRDSANFAMVTNWSSFAEDLLQIEGCELDIHLPVMNTEEMAWDVMVPFTSQKGKKGVICWVVNTDEEKLRKALPVGELVSKELFC
jgi:hypothetical protein